VLFASHHRLENLVAIVDYNKLQAFGLVKDIINLEPFPDKWRAFGWAVREIDGHNLPAIEETLSNIPLEEGKPSCIIAHTVKGKGVTFMENQLIWHYKYPDAEELRQALAELGISQ
ncbi:transketolase, partial [Chloroflexota bacterium]